MFILTHTHEFINVQPLQHASFSFVTQLIMSLKLCKSLSINSWISADATHCMSLLELPLHACMCTHTHLPSSFGKQEVREGCSTATAALDEGSVDVISTRQYENLRSPLRD
jgi:hypothetical protein